MILQLLTLRDSAFKNFSSSEKSHVQGGLVLLLTGLLYGSLLLIANRSYILSFETPALKWAIVPLIFMVSGLMMAWLTRIGLTLVVWAGARGFGGEGVMGRIRPFVSISLLPGLLAVPLLTGWQMNALGIVLATIGVFWMLIFHWKTLQTTQQFSKVKAGIAAITVFVFFVSIYYLVVPTGAITS
ncbi:hypothetical protein JOD03_002415 [Chryseomicrobium aureum]|uniref:YIP1 family protein n=1 Tax=Chryseomicrobium aureum TaxID=1441723 RepID=UPI00195DD7E2|nr:YIP1 family protein [Chryseomicrobium aureum]MBM7707468.1 hypothetical protein [Chryseomicrobium aureum]